MFDGLREKFQSVQGNISASLRGFSTNEHNTQLPNKQIHLETLNLHAGIEVLEKFQTNWADLNAQSLQNAKQAEVVDELIGKLHKRLEIQWRNVNQACSALSKLPEVVNEMDIITGKIDELGALFQTVEKSLINLEDLLETRALQDRQLDHRFQLALYKENKLSHLENARVALALEHAEKVTVHEARQQRIQKERQEAFEQQFKQDLNIYKETNNVPKIDPRASVKNEMTLEEVILDSDDPEALDEFLHESTPEKLTEESAEDENSST